MFVVVNVESPERLRNNKNSSFQFSVSNLLSIYSSHSMHSGIRTFVPKSPRKGMMLSRSTPATSQSVKTNCCWYIFLAVVIMLCFVFALNCNDLITVYVLLFYSDIMLMFGLFSFFLSFFCFRLHLLGCLGTVVWFAMHDLVVVFSTPGTRHPSSPRPVPKRHMSAPELDASAETWIWSVDVNLLPEAAGSRKLTAEWACRPLSDASPTACWRNFWSSWTTLPST